MLQCAADEPIIVEPATKTKKPRKSKAICDSSAHELSRATTSTCAHHITAYAYGTPEVGHWFWLMQIVTEMRHHEACNLLSSWDPGSAACKQAGLLEQTQIAHQATP